MALLWKAIMAAQPVQEGSNVVQLSLLPRGEREAFPPRRKSITHKVRVGDSPPIFLHMGVFPDGRLGEIFIDVSKVGSTLQGILDAFGKIFSIALQYGTPLEEMVSSLKFSSFEPYGPVMGDDEIQTAQSIIDWLAKRLERDFLNPTGIHPVS